MELLREVEEPSAESRKSSGRLAEFLMWCEARLGHDAVRKQTSDYEEDVGGSERRIPACVYPSNRHHVIEVVREANRRKITLYPVSRGCNWGFGSSLPVRDGCVVVDLKRMNAVASIDESHGVACIEPGVTQGQLAAQLSAQKSRFYLDVTCAGPDTSIVGNALERGIAHSSLRCEAVRSLEIVLGNGTVIRTGFGHVESARTKNLYRHGIGPSLDGLFFQSNYGIVIAATIQLLPRPECEVIFQVAADGSRLGALIETLGRLRRDRILDCIVHVSNPERVVKSVAPAVQRKLRDLGLSHWTVSDIVRPERMAEWTARGVVRGTPAQVRLAKRRLRRELRSVGKVRFISRKTLRSLVALLRKVGRTRDYVFLEAALPLFGALSGHPATGSVEGVAWGFDTDEKKWIDPDRTQAGLLFCMPLAPLEGGAARELVAEARRISAAYELEPEIMLNVLNESLLEAVIGIRFLRPRRDERQRAQQCIQMLHRRFHELGLPPYRVGIEQMEQAVREDDPFWQVVCALKEVLDPNHIIAPGRYNLV